MKDGKIERNSKKEGFKGTLLRRVNFSCAWQVKVTSSAVNVF